MIDDRELLARYAGEGSEADFAELTRRHAGLVYSAALRQVRDQALAQDVTQLVFAHLARRARSVAEKTVLAGWLHRDTRYTALDLIRANARRRRREQEFIEMNTPNPGPQPAWEEIRPLLDEALTELAPADRDALLLRFFEQRDFAGVGAALGASAEAARKRVERALERLRGVLVKRGITSTTAALGGALMAHGVEPLPAEFVASLAAGATVGAAPSAGGWLSNLMLMTKTKIAIGAVLAGILAMPLMIQQQALAAARFEHSELLARLRGLATLAAEIRSSASEVSIPAAPARAELVRLRRQAAALRGQIAEFSSQADQLLAANPAHKPGSTPLGDVLSFDTAYDAGQATPAATMQTFLWAMAHGDTNRVMQLMDVEAGTNGQPVQATLEKLSKEFAKESSEMSFDVTTLGKNLDKIEVYLLEEQPGGNGDRWVIAETVGTGNEPSISRILFRPSDTGWRWVVGTNGEPVEEDVKAQP